MASSDSSSSCRDFPKRSFSDGEVGGGNSGVDAIWSQVEIADDVISGEHVHAFWYYVCPNLWPASFSSFQENLNQPLM